MNRIKQRLAVLLIAIALACGGLITTSASPAAAHNESNYSLWYCSMFRSFDGEVITHSKVYGVWPGTIGYYCREDFFGHSNQYWVAVAPPYSGNAWMPYPRQECYPHGIIVCIENP